MAIRSWTITDVSKGIFSDEWTMPSSEARLSLAACSVSKRTLRGGLSDGVESIRICNGRLAFDLLPTRGMGLWKAWLGDFEIGWQSPVRGPVHPKYVLLAEPSGLGWLDGFDELMVRCGLESNGAPDFEETGRLKYPLHGRIANRPAHKVVVVADGDAGQIAVTGEVEEARFHFTKFRLVSTVSTRAGEAALTIRDEVINLSGSPAEFQMLYHVNIGQPPLDPGARFVAPVRRVVPRDARAAEGILTWDRYPGEIAGYREQVYYMKLHTDPDGKTRTMLRDSRGTRGISILFNTQQLPCYTLWKNTTTSPDGYVTGLEPGTNFPNPRTFEGRKGRVVKLEPGARTQFEICMQMHWNAAEVGNSENAISALRADREPELADHPQPGWCVM